MPEFSSMFRVKEGKNCLKKKLYLTDIFPFSYSKQVLDVGILSADWLTSKTFFYMNTVACSQVCVMFS